MRSPMATFLLKTEPGTYSFADLAKAKKCTWDGVSNPQALAFLRTMRKGDEVLVYHTGDEKAVVGLASVTKDPYEDPNQPGLTADGKPKFAVVDLAATRPAPKPVTLAALKADGRFESFLLVTHARLSVMPVPPDLDRTLRKLCGL